MEEDVTYTTVVFKTKKPLQPEVQKKEEETVYDEVKVRSEATEKPGTNPKKEEIVYDELKACSEKNQHTLDMNASAELLLDKKEDDRRRWYQQLAWCLGTLFVILLLGVIAVCIYCKYKKQLFDGQHSGWVVSTDAAQQEGAWYVYHPGPS
ncbi:hypothetical protein XENORESO_003789 [Xenotaenia resolanae]|uniref:Uncharacterized protein n=1 Tax=Xenotaenia resolanae TaxID=208358 RepID=A0ABV0VV36_9TELE